MPHLTHKALRIDEILSRVGSPEAGAVCLFVGNVRNHNKGRSVTGILYEAYEEMAEEQLAKIEEEMLRTFPIQEVVLVHRLGLVAVGESAVLVAVSSSHREEGFAACRYGIDQIKERVPIWKKEYTADGPSWVGAPPEGEGVRPKNK